MTGKLDQLCPRVGKGAVWVRGRAAAQDLAAALGSTELPLILRSEPLATSILNLVHCQDHRLNPRDTCARARKLVWMTAAHKTAERLINRCPVCKIRSKRLAAQQMGELHQQNLSAVGVFEAVGLDLMGPFYVKDTAKGRRRFKCWISVYVCVLQVRLDAAVPRLRHHNLPVHPQAIHQPVRSPKVRLH